MTTKQAALTLGISLARVHQLIRDGRLRASKLGRDYWIQDGDLDAVRVRQHAGRPRKAVQSV